jgi:predicted ATPase/DNA-binding SARP family transcriptional activator
MVAMLACQNNWVTRDEVMLLLWAEDGDDGAIKQRLRQLLYRAKQMPYGEAVETTSSQLRYLGESDVVLFRAALEARNWQQAVLLYQGELLRGALFDHAELEEWFGLERATLSAGFRLAALEHASGLAAPEASLFLEQALMIEPLSEELLKTLLEYALAAPEVGLRAFERYKRDLAQNLQLVPHEDIQGLVNQLAPTSRANVYLQTKGFKLPLANSTFVGRQAELEQIEAQLKDPHCRLLSLIGIGGIGKTRLSLEVASRIPMRDGAIFVDLARLNDARLVPNAILEALGERPSEQALLHLQQVLANKLMLVVLDNFEHVMEARDIVATLLEKTETIRFVVTSRESLGLRAEQVIELSGLPAPDTVFPLESQDAALLFIGAAQRSHLDFSLKNDFLTFNRIYQAVAGMPLGLELAASWIRTLTLSEIADELEQSLDVLAVDAPDIPTRHRSFAAVFQSSWALLSQSEQIILAKLSIFRGGFDKDMAIQVTNANLPLLLRLVNKSLIARREQRFMIHELIRQYSQQQLNPESQAQALLGLAKVTIQLSEQWFLHAKDEQQTEWSRRIELELDNIRTVLTWALTSQPQLGTQLVGNLEHFWYLRGYHREGIEWAKQYLAVYPEPNQIRLRAIWTQTSLGKELSEYDLARVSIKEYQQLATALADPQALAAAEKFYGLLEREQGNLELGKSHLEKAQRMFTELNDVNAIAVCINDLGIIYAMQQDLEMAKQYFSESLRLKRQIGDKQGIAYAIGNLGIIAGQQGDLTLERVMQQESLRLKRELSDQQGIANGLLELGRNAFDQENIEAALDHYAEALEIYCRLERRFSIIHALNNFAMVAHKLGDLKQAIIFATASLSLSYQFRITPPDGWLKRKLVWHSESGLSPAQLAQLEFETERLDLSQIIAQVFTWKHQVQLPSEPVVFAAT